MQSVGVILPDYDIRVTDLKRMIENDYTVALGNVSGAEEYRNRIEHAIVDLSSALKPLVKASQKLEAVVADARKALSDAFADEEGSFYNFSSFHGFLVKAKSLWDEVPLWENEALAKAVEYYRRAYESGDNIGGSLQQVQVAYLVGELFRRIGDHKNAGQYYNQTIRLGRDIIHDQEVDNSTTKYTRTLLEMAMEQARLNQQESQGAMT